MKFYSHYSHARYTVEPTYYRLAGPHRETVHGIAAEFDDNRFDSEVAQKQLRWTDEQREQVESYLMAHADYGKTLRAIPDGELAEAQAPQEIAVCLFRVTIDGDVEACGRPSVSSDGYCAKHANMTEVPELKPNRQRAKAPA